MACHVSQAVGAHPAADVVDGDDRRASLPADNDPHSFAGASRLGVLVRRIGHELIQGVLGVLVRLPCNEHRVGEAANA